jgi:carbonic anhydrase
MKNIKKLLSGYSRFYKNHLQRSGSDSHYQKLLKQDQKPIAIVIGCCDSRVDPAIILDCDPGDLFVIRNVANLVPPYENDRHYHGTSAALEFGVCSLNIPNIIILGHSGCGGIRSLLDKGGPNKKTTFISKWMRLVKIPSSKQMESYQHLTHRHKEELYGKKSLTGSLKNLMTFPWIKQRIETNKLRLYGWYFNLSTGSLEEYNPMTKEFNALTVKDKD